MKNSATMPMSPAGQLAMPRLKQTDAERLEALQAEIKRLEVLAAKKKADIQAKERRLASRRAFLLGECLLAQKALPEPLKRELGEMLEAFLTRPADRAILSDWLPEITARETSASERQPAPQPTA